MPLWPIGEHRLPLPVSRMVPKTRVSHCREALLSSTRMEVDIGGDSRSFDRSRFHLRLPDHTLIFSHSWCHPPVPCRIPVVLHWHSCISALHSPWPVILQQGFSGHSPVDLLLCAGFFIGLACGNVARGS